MKKRLTRIGAGKDTQSRADAKVMQKMSSGLRLELLHGLDNVGDLRNKKLILYQAYLNVMEQSKDANDISSSRSLFDSVILMLDVKLKKTNSHII